MSNEDLLRLKKNLKVAREAAGVSQRDAGAEVGVSRQTIVNWENPQITTEPSSAELAVLAKRYGVTSKDLRFEELERRPAAARQDMPAESFETREQVAAEAAKKKHRPA